VTISASVPGIISRNKEERKVSGVLKKSVQGIYIYEDLTLDGVNCEMDGFEDRVHAIVPFLGGDEDIPVGCRHRITYLSTRAELLDPASEVLGAFGVCILLEEAKDYMILILE
jgi:hypothetical protein